MHRRGDGDNRADKAVLAFRSRRVGPTATVAALVSVRRGACRTRRRRPRGRTVIGGKRNLGYPTTDGQAIVFASHSSHAIFLRKRRQPTQVVRVSAMTGRWVCVRRREQQVPRSQREARPWRTPRGQRYRSCWIAFFILGGTCGLSCRWWPQHCPRRIGNLARKAPCCRTFQPRAKEQAESRLACLRSPLNSRPALARK